MSIRLAHQTERSVLNINRAITDQYRGIFGKMHVRTDNPVIWQHIK